MLSSDRIFARFPSMNKLIVMLLTHCESNNKKVKHLYRRECSIQLMMKLVFLHQSAHKIVGEIYTKMAEDAVRAPFGTGK